MRECFAVTRSFEPKCREVCSDAEYEILKRAFFEKEQNLLIEQAISYISELFRSNAGGHDTEHTLRVRRNAMMIAETESGCDREITELAALLHDADDHKLFHTENNRNARTFLEGRIDADLSGRTDRCRPDRADLRMHQFRVLQQEPGKDSGNFGGKDRAGCGPA